MGTNYISGTTDRLRRCQLSSPMSVINFWRLSATVDHTYRRDLYSAARPNKRNCLITMRCNTEYLACAEPLRRAGDGSVSGSGDSCYCQCSYYDDNGGDDRRWHDNWTNYRAANDNDRRHNHDWSNDNINWTNDHVEDYNAAFVKLNIFVTRMYFFMSMLTSSSAVNDKPALRGGSRQTAKC